MSSRYKTDGKQGMSSSSSSSSSSGRSRSSSSSSSRSRSNSPDTRRRQKRERDREYSKSTTNRRHYDDRSNSSNSNSHDHSQSSQQHQQHQQRDQQRNYSQKYKDSKSSSSVDYNSIRSDKSSDSTTSGGGRNTEKNFSTTKILMNIAETDEKIPDAPAPPKISKSAILFGKPGTVTKPGIQMKLIPPKAKSETTKKITVASAFNNESDDEADEEMPAECRMRMRNIGRDTPTSSGPNSFGKTKQGFVDTKKVFERSLREACAD